MELLTIPSKFYTFILKWHMVLIYTLYLFESLKEAFIEGLLSKKKNLGVLFL